MKKSLISVITRYSSVSSLSAFLRTLREIYNHHTNVLFPHAEDAKVAKILSNNTCDKERSLATRDKRAQRLAVISSYLLLA